MSSKAKAVLAFAAAIVVCVAVASAQTQMLSGRASVIDGDTIELRGQSVRLSGFDAPERGIACGPVDVHQRASEALGRFVGGRTIICSVIERDGARLVATCRADGRDLGELMVASGWARDWPRFSAGAYADEEASAREGRRGLWALSCGDEMWSGRDYTASAPQVLTRESVEIGARTALRASPDIAYVSASALNVRDGPGGEFSVTARLIRNARVEVLDVSGDWRLIQSGAVRGWVSGAYLSAEPHRPRPVQGGQSDASIRQALIARSLASYAGSCPCPYNVDRGGRRCGGRSAYSRPGGASPLCYAGDVSDAAVQAFRMRQ